MSTPSPPKPWERAGAVGDSSPIGASTAMTATTNPITNPSASTTSSTSTVPPALPSRPDSLNNVVNQTASNYSAYGQNRFNSPYSNYSSPYSTYGGGMGGMYGGGGMYGSSMYGGGGMYGSSMYGGGMYNRPYGGGFGQPPFDPNNPNAQSLTQTWNQSTAATFQIMESIVGAFGGFAQMLESAYMTTHSSFFAMVSMAEQLGNLRQTLGQVLGIYTLLRWMRTIIAKMTGRPPPADATALTPAAFSSFMTGTNAPATLPDGSPAPPRASKKPFIMFALAVFGLPYLMSKLIRGMARAQEAEQQRALAAQGIITRPDGTQTLDLSRVDFCRVLYDYTPIDTQQQQGMQPGMVAKEDLAVRKGDFVAVLSKLDPEGRPSEWWRCRARDGKVGWLPSVYLQKIERKTGEGQGQGQIASSAHDNGNVSLPGSRTSTLVGQQPDGRTKSLVEVGGVEGFQRSAFYS